MLDHIEQYKTQQLERLRDNYTQQVELTSRKDKLIQWSQAKNFVCPLLRSAIYSEAVQL